MKPKVLQSSKNERQKELQQSETVAKKLRRKVVLMLMDAETQAGELEEQDNLEELNAASGREERCNSATHLAL